MKENISLSSTISCQYRLVSVYPLSLPDERTLVKEIRFQETRLPYQPSSLLRLLPSLRHILSGNRMESDNLLKKRKTPR
jgi:hypothetical protein